MYGLALSGARPRAPLTANSESEPGRAIDQRHRQLAEVPMSDNQTLTRRWLRQNIAPYSNQDLVYGHVDAVLTAYPTLRPKTDVYTFDDGRSQLMLCVYGLLPITYRRVSYNIPVAIWLPHAYPSNVPIVYVVPTSDMLVKASKHVDISGRCNFPYTQSWQTKSETYVNRFTKGCNLVALIEVLVDAFSTQPPVYAKPSQPAVSPPPPQPSPSLRDYSVRPPPTVPSGYVSPPLSHRIHSPQPPPLPPHPSGPSQRTFSGTHSSHAQDPPMYTIPQQRLTSSYSIPHSLPSQQLPIPSRQPPPPIQPNLHVIESSQVVPFAQPSSQTYYSPQSSSSQTQHSSQHPSSRYESPSLLPGHPYPQTTRNYLEEDIEDIPSLQHAPSTVPPPRPPNPEILRLHADILAKINSEYSALDYALNTDMQRLRTAQGDLLAGEAAIHDEMGRLQAVRDVCSVVADRYRTTIQSTEANLNELRRKGDPEVDELICSTSIVYNQLIDLVTEDNAIEDTIYHLHRALNAARALAEEQFMKRALAQKIVSLIPMGAWA